MLRRAELTVARVGGGGEKGAAGGGDQTGKKKQELVAGQGKGEFCFFQ